MKNTFLIAALLTWFSLLGQTPAYLHYSVEDGLPSTMVYCAVQDQKGFIWFGTNNGLARFDGSRFKTFSKDDGLPDPEVLNLFEDSQERLWISCFQKAPCYLKDGKFFTTENDQFLREGSFKSAKHYYYEDKQNRIWIGDIRKMQKCYFSNQGSKCYDTHLLTSNQTCEIGDRLISFGMRRLVDITDPLSPKLIYERNLGGFPTNPSAFHQDQTIYVSKGNKMTALTLTESDLQKTTYSFDVPNEQNNINLIENNHVWLNYPHTLDGIYKIDLANEKALPVNYLKGKKVSNILKDAEGNLWFTTLNDGIFVMRKKSIILFSQESAPFLSSDNLTSIAKSDYDNYLFLGTETGEIYTIENNELKHIKHKKRINTSKVRQIVPLSQNHWAATMDKDIYVEKNNQHDPKFKLYNYQDSDFIGIPKYLLRDSNRVWIGHINGLHYWEDHKEEPITVLLNKRVTAIGKDNGHNIWIGGMDGLLSRKDAFKVFWGHKFPLLAGRIIDIKNAGENHLWVATAENDLIKVEVKNGKVVKAKAMNEVLPFPIKNIKNLYLASDNTLWASTNSGVYGIKDQLKVQHLNTSDGLPGNDVNAVIVDHDTLWAATTKGAVKIQLDTDKSIGNFTTYISAILYELKNVQYKTDLVYSQKNDITVPAGATMIEIQLSGLHYGSDGNFVFEYIEEEQLLPLQWITWSNLSSNIAKLFSGKADTTLLKNSNRYFGAHVPKGNFKTTVTAIAKDGTRSLHADTKTFTILPYWYETIWFSLLIICLTGYIIWLFLRQYTRAKRFQRAASELQLAAIKAQVNPHFVGNSINAIQQFFYPPDPASASQYIATFTSLLRQTMHLSEVPFISFEKESSFITDYLKMVKLRFGERFEYQVVEKDDIPKETLFPAMILQPILENATIHGFAPEGISRLSSTFELKENKLVCTITDNGVGIEKSKRLKKNQNRKRVSKGIQLLQDKINVMNKMYGLDLKIEYLDLSSINKNLSGTQVTLSYSPDKITQ
ncbi:MAG: two-component regulator propeller domain-containing protein [Bacteroidota bacterium]